MLPFVSEPGLQAPGLRRLGPLTETSGLSIELSSAEFDIAVLDSQQVIDSPAAAMRDGARICEGDR